VTARELRGAVEGIPALRERLEEVWGMFDAAAARADGKIRLTPGSDAEYDSAMRGRVRAAMLDRERDREREDGMRCRCEVEMRGAGGRLCIGCGGLEEP